MIHSKANSSNIDGRNNLNNLIENENSLNENTSSNKEPINTTNDNLNINLIAEGKISELLLNAFILSPKQKYLYLLSSESIPPFIKIGSSHVTSRLYQIPPIFTWFQA